MLQPTIRVLPDPDAVAAAAAELVAILSEEAIAAKGVFTVALSGGSTPKSLFKRLAGTPYVDDLDYPQWEVYFVDERCVPPDHPESNYRMADQELLSKVDIPRGRVFRMAGEQEPESAATAYGRMLKERFGDSGPDLVLLGMGEDGHTASLFPHTPALDEHEHRCVAQYVEKSTTGPSWRITLTAPFINRAGTVAILTTGASKSAAVQRALEGPDDPHQTPVKLIAPASGKLHWIIDIPAAGMDLNPED